MGKKGGKRGRAGGDLVEDLDMDVMGEVEEDPIIGDEDEEEVVVHNKRRKEQYDDLDIKPSEAYKLEGMDLDDGQGGADEEEALLAVQTRKLQKKGLKDQDFAIPGVTDVTPKKKSAVAAATPALATSAVVEEVERNFSALSANERMKVIKKESPELLKLMQEFSTNMAEVKKLSEPLRKLLSRKPSMTEEATDSVGFLESKMQLMLSYCMHIQFYLLLKIEGKKVKDHPVVDRLVEIRTYLEKIVPIEKKLHYSLAKLINSVGGGEGAAAAKAKPSSLRPVLQDTDAYAPAKTKLIDQGREARKARKVLEEAEAIEKEEEATMQRMRGKGVKRADVRNAMKAADQGYTEDADQFFTKMTQSKLDDEEDMQHQGQTLIERLRKKGAPSQTQQVKVAPQELGALQQGEMEEEEDSEFDMEGLEDMEDFPSEDGLGDDEEYAELLAEEQAREREEGKKKRSSKPVGEMDGYVEPQQERREITQRIQNHRGLTRARPKDKKTPRTAHRAKYNKGLTKAKAQSRSVKPEPEGGFQGVKNIKANVTHSTRFA